MSDPIGLGISLPENDRNQSSNASQTNTTAKTSNRNGNQNHDRPEGQESRQEIGRSKNHGKNHGRARWNNVRNNRHQQQQNHGNFYHPQNRQPYQQLPMAYSQHSQQGYHQAPDAYYPRHHQPIPQQQQQMQNIHLNYLGYDSNLSSKTAVQNAFEESKYAHGRNRSRHLGLPAFQQQALEQQKYHLSQSRYYSSSQKTNPYTLIGSFPQDRNSCAHASQDLPEINDAFQYQRNAIDSARARLNAAAHQQMQPHVKLVGEGIWETMTQDGTAHYWYEPQPFVMRAEAAVYVPRNAGVGLVATGPVGVTGSMTGANDKEGVGEAGN
ncbi:Serine/threonine-protein kinase [Venturia inaequalis]|nr:Serine/threonine-protein kinase [Venturia inaequalis]